MSMVSPPLKTLKNRRFYQIFGKRRVYKETSGMKWVNLSNFKETPTFKVASDF